MLQAIQYVLGSPKLARLLKSRKFWALITALVTIAAGVETNTMPASQGVLAAVAALSTYSVGTAIDDNGNTPVVPHG